MTPIQKLMDEHRRIVAVLDSFDQYAARSVSSDSYDRVKLADYVGFLRHYADAYHHAKEENILFEEMAKHGFSTHSGPVGMMLYEHDEGRKLVSFLKEASEETDPQCEDEVRAVANAIRSFTDLLRAHIMKEDNILYPMAQAQLPKEAWFEMAPKFDAVENARNESGEVERLESLAATLAGAR